MPTTREKIETVATENGWTKVATDHVHDRYERDGLSVFSEFSPRGGVGWVSVRGDGEKHPLNTRVKGSGKAEQIIAILTTEEPKP